MKNNTLWILAAIAAGLYVFSRSKTTPAANRVAAPSSSSQTSRVSDVVTKYTEKGQAYAKQANDALNGVAPIISAGSGLLKTVAGFFPSSTTPDNEVVIGGIDDSLFDPPTYGTPDVTTPGEVIYT